MKQIKQMMQLATKVLFFNALY